MTRSPTRSIIGETIKTMRSRAPRPSAAWRAGAEVEGKMKLLLRALAFGVAYLMLLVWNVV
jgi:hypothetical protein